MNTLTIPPAPISKWIGIYFYGPAGIYKAWQITCPCGITVTYPINNLPLVDTKHPCNHPEHWTIRYDKA